VIQVSGEEAIAPLDSVASVSTSKLRKLAGVSCDHSIEIHLLRVKHSRQIVDTRKRQGGLRRFTKPRKHSCPICILIGGQQLGKYHFAGQLHDCAKQIIFVVEMTIDRCDRDAGFSATVSIEV
jgi:hypothetical protein